MARSDAVLKGYQGRIEVGMRFRLTYPEIDAVVHLRVTAIVLHGDCEPEVQLMRRGPRDLVRLWASDLRRLGKRVAR